MRIAFIGQKGIPAISGGVENHVEHLAVRLAARGHEVTVYTRPRYTDPKLSEYEGVKLVSLPSIPTKHLDAISHAFIATLHALFCRYDVIHYQSIGPSILSIIPRILKPSSRVIATFHSRDYFHKKWNVFARFFLRLAERATFAFPEWTIAISETLTGYAKEAYSVRSLSFIPNGAEVSYEQDMAPLSRFGLRPKRYVLSVSRLIEHKGIHYLIKAFRDLEESNKMPNNFKLAIVGTHAETPEYEQYLKVMAEGHPNIVFLGERSGKELASIFSHAALFVQPSEDEGLSVALLEAMGYGLLPIVSGIPANVEAVKHDAGAIFEPKNVDALKEKLAYYINRPDEAEMIGRIAKERISRQYGWDAIADQTETLYRDLMSGRSIKERYAHIESK
jgi:glycosyltransferase involved in cell wall biosynthesis